jgi:hypothetical protein
MRIANVDRAFLALVPVVVDEGADRIGHNCLAFKRTQKVIQSLRQFLWVELGGMR